MLNAEFRMKTGIAALVLFAVIAVSVVGSPVAAFAEDGDEGGEVEAVAAIEDDGEIVPVEDVGDYIEQGGGFIGGDVYQTSPYKTYSYDYWNRSLYAPAAYAPSGRLSGRDMGVSSFLEPSDVYVRGEKLYVADTGNGRVVAYDMAESALYRSWEGYEYNGEYTAFNQPSGVFVAEDGLIYVADTENRRVVVMDHMSNTIRVVENPQSETLPDNFEFRPLKVAVDASGRMYVIAKNVFEGIMYFDYAGNFQGYYGTIKVSVNPIDWFWRSISTKAQKAKLSLFIPTEFSSLDIDDDGFVYTTNVDRYSSDSSIKRLNPAGQDVLVNYSLNNKKIVGDYESRGMDKSILKDIKYRGSGMYSAVDYTLGHVFTYDGEGNLLYVFGGIGWIDGMARKPVAVEQTADGTMILLDQGRGELLFYKATEYGALINQAIQLRYGGDEAQAVAIWERVLEMDANNQLAFIGIGKSYLAAGENKKAMEYLKKGMDVTYYSVAFKRYRNDVLRGSLPVVLTVGLSAVVLYVVYRMARKSRRGRVAQ